MEKIYKEGVAWSAKKSIKGRQWERNGEVSYPKRYGHEIQPIEVSKGEKIERKRKYFTEAVSSELRLINVSKSRKWHFEDGYMKKYWKTVRDSPSTKN